jgi:hypothetical protein
MRLASKSIEIRSAFETWLCENALLDVILAV